MGLAFGTMIDRMTGLGAIRDKDKAA